MKSEEPDTLLAAIDKVLAGEAHVSRRVAAGLMHNLFPNPRSSSPNLARLSDRELQGRLPPSSSLQFVSPASAVLNFFCHSEEKI